MMLKNKYISLLLIIELFNFSSISNNETNKISVDELIKLIWWNDRCKGRFPGLIGMEILSVEHGHVNCQLKVHEELLAPNGYLHAGCVVTLADTACGYGCLFSKPSDAKLFTTIELNKKANFLGTVKPPALIKCEAKLVHGGKTTQVKFGMHTLKMQKRINSLQSLDVHN